MSDEWVRVRVQTWVEGRDGTRETVEAMRVLSPVEAKELDHLVHFLCRDLIELMLNKNHLFGHTIGPLRVVTEPFRVDREDAVPR